jgi:hypothetical protein
MPVLALALLLAASDDCNDCRPIGNGLVACTLIGCTADSSTAWILKPDTSAIARLKRQAEQLQKKLDSLDRYLCQKEKELAVEREHCK